MDLTKRLKDLSRLDRGRNVAYWAFTLPVAFENAAGAVWVLLPLIPGLNRLHASLVFSGYLRGMLTHLGYPQYFQYILGPWQLACAAALVAPALPRLKEWAYAGAFFNYWAAFLSHAFAGDKPDGSAAVLAVLAILSWALRPTDRRLTAAAPVRRSSARAWARSAGILAVLLILSLFWLPAPR